MSGSSANFFFSVLHNSMKVITVSQDIINAFDKLPNEAVLYMIYLQRKDLYNYSPTVQAGFLTMFRKYKYIQYPIYNIENHSISCGEHIMYFPRLNWTGISDDLKRKIIFFNFTGSAIQASETLGLTQPKYEKFHGNFTHIPESIHMNGGYFLYPIMGDSCPHLLYELDIWDTPQYKTLVFTLEKMFSVELMKKIMTGEHFAPQAIRKKTTVLERIKQTVTIGRYATTQMTDNLRNQGYLDFEIHEDDMNMLQRSLHFEEMVFNYVAGTLKVKFYVQRDNHSYMYYPIRLKTNCKKERQKRKRAQHFIPNTCYWDRGKHDARKKRKLYNSNYEFEPVRTKVKNSTSAPLYWPLPNTSVQTRGKFRNHVHTGKVKFDRVWRYEIQNETTLEKEFITEGKVSQSRTRSNWGQTSLYVIGDKTFKTRKRKRLVECSEIFDGLYKRVKKAEHSEPKNPIHLGNPYNCPHL